MRLIEKNGFKFYIRSYPRFDDEFCVNEVLVEDLYKLKESKFTNGTIVDIGANIGTFAIPASKYGVVYAYEPNIENFRILLMNIAINKANVKAFNYAVGKPGWDTIENSSGHSRIGRAGGSGKQQVEVIGFDDIPVEDIDLLKMDCEGGEYDVIKYALDENLNKVKKIVGELHSWIFDDYKYQKEIDVNHKEMLAKLRRFFKLDFSGFKNSAFSGIKK